LQGTAGNTNEGSHLPPQHLQVGLTKLLSLLVTKVPKANDLPCPLYGFTQTQSLQHPHAIGLHCNASPHSFPLGALFYQFRLETMLVQGGGQRQPGNASANNQETFCVSHGSFLC